MRRLHIILTWCQLTLLCVYIVSKIKDFPCSDTKKLKSHYFYTKIVESSAYHLWWVLYLIYYQNIWYVTDNISSTYRKVVSKCKYTIAYFSKKSTDIQNDDFLSNCIQQLFLLLLLTRYFTCGNQSRYGIYKLFSCIKRKYKLNLFKFHISITVLLSADQLYIKLYLCS